MLSHEASLRVCLYLLPVIFRLSSKTDPCVSSQRETHLS